MTDESITDALLREFLLGKVAGEEQERIENLFLTDSQTRERVLAIEQELIDDYLEDDLTEEEKEMFLSRYAQTDEQRRKLRITKSITDWAAAESLAPQVVAPTVSMWSRLHARLRLKPLWVVPIAVTILIVIVLAIVWLNSQRERRQHLAIEQELAQLNSPARLREVPQDMSSYELKSFTHRNAERQPELKPEAHIRIVELRLPWVQKERYSSYQAEVRRGDGTPFTIRNLSAQNELGNFIRLRLPTHMLSRGSYRIQMSGIADDGTPGLTQEYNFVVGD